MWPLCEHMCPKCRTLLLQMMSAIFVLFGVYSVFYGRHCYDRWEELNAGWVNAVYTPNVFDIFRFCFRVHSLSNFISFFFRLSVPGLRLSSPWPCFNIDLFRSLFHWYIVLHLYHLISSVSAGHSLPSDAIEQIQIRMRASHKIIYANVMWNIIGWMLFSAVFLL